MQGNVKLGFVPAHRGMFPVELAQRGRAETLDALQHMGLTVVVPDPSLTESGCVESLEDARKAARLFRDEDVHGIIIGAMNFGDEQAAAMTARLADLDVPVLIFGLQEEETLKATTRRRDSLCGLLSIGEALRQVGLKYSVGETPVCFPTDASFARDVDHFARVCRVLHGLRNARYGQVGMRPNDFWTCRYNEKALQQLGATVVTLDLSEALLAVRDTADDDPSVQQIVEEMSGGLDTGGVSGDILLRLAKFEKFLADFAETNGLDALTVQCWTSLQLNLGICSCLAMGRLGDRGTPCACESDVNGALSMHALLLASGSPSALADVNNLHNEDPELVNLWHCGVFPASYAAEKPRLGAHFILGETMGPDNASGVLEFRMKGGPLTLTRVTEDGSGKWKAFIAQGTVEDNPATTSGAYGWCRIPEFQKLYSQILLRHFPHHVGISQSHMGNVLYEALGGYLGMDVYVPEQAVPGLYAPGRPFVESVARPLAGGMA